MAGGKRRVSASVGLVAAAAMLLAASGVVACVGTGEIGSGGVGSAVIGCRADRVIAPDDLLEQLHARPPVDWQLIGVSGVSFVMGRDGVQVSAGVQGGRGSCTGAAQSTDGNHDPGGMGDGIGQFPGWVRAAGPFLRDFVSVELVAPSIKLTRFGSTGSAGSFTSPCGTNAQGHRNADNFMVAPGKVNGGRHIHDYVGNLSTNAFSTDESLAAAGTTCANGDKSTYFWPVLRNTGVRGVDADVRGGGLDGNVGDILRPAAVRLEFRGSPGAQVTAMPANLALMTGDAKAASDGGANAHAAWTCTGFEDRTTTKYPLCPQGSQLVRILDFPSCWDGTNLDSANHRTHVVFPQQGGSCSAGKVTLPQLRITLTFDRPVGRAFAVDAFPDEQHQPITDHADFMNLMPSAVMAQAVDCINTGRTC